MVILPNPSNSSCILEGYYCSAHPPLPLDEVKPWKIFIADSVRNATSEISTYILQREDCSKENYSLQDTHNLQLQLPT